MLVGAKNQQADAIEQNLLHTSSAVEEKELTVTPIEIHNGFVIFEGRYIPPPYIVESKEDKIYINDLEVPQVHVGPFYRHYGSTRDLNQTPQNRAVARIEQHLRQDTMLIYTQSDSRAFVPTQLAISILDVLLGDEPGDTKVQTLLKIGASWIASDQWVLLVENFDAPAELAERVIALKQRYTELGEEDADNEWYWIFLSSITIIGFVLSVWALGTLLGCRSPVIQGWRNTDQSRDSCHQVIHLVIMIVILNIYDLICTLFANGVGGLWELNPFAGLLIESNHMIVTFKLSLTIGAAILFLVNRYHRLAQIGAWWLGVLYTVLILRWTIFNSMFLS